MKILEKFRARTLHSNESGFTLVEVLVAAALFLSVFMTLATLFAQSTTDLSGTRLITASMMAQAAIEEAVRSGTPESGHWTEESNRILWEIDRTVERTSAVLLEIRVTVRRVSDGKSYASLWTQLYRPTAL